MGDSALPEASAAAVRSVLLTGPDATAVELLGRQLAAKGVELHTGGEEPPDSVVLVVGAAPGQEEGADAVGRAQETALAAFDVALGRLDATRARRMVVLTEDVHTTGVAAERPRPAHAVLGGALLALPVETPGRSAVGVDLCSLDTPAQRLAAVLAELRADGDGAPGEAVTVAWRAGRRLTRRIAPLAARVAAVSPLPSDGTFLITGGGGGIGGALARELAGKGRPTLVLAGRSPQPPAGFVEELQALGATVHYRVADVSVEGDVDALIGQLPRLDGLFHAAGWCAPAHCGTGTPGRPPPPWPRRPEGPCCSRRLCDGTGSIRWSVSRSRPSPRCCPVWRAAWASTPVPTPSSTRSPPRSGGRAGPGSP